MEYYIMVGCDSKIKKREYILYLCIAVASVIAFCVIYGTKVLNFTWTDWAFYSIDLPQHFLGWKAFRQGEWTFPIGMSNTLSYPIDTSIIFTDSIPLLAVFFKFLSPILPENFQYFGLCSLLSFVLQGVIAGHILFHLVCFKKDKSESTYDSKNEYPLWKLISVLGLSMLIVIMPCLLWRMFVHIALAQQWLILLALEPILLYDRAQDGIDTIAEDNSNTDLLLKKYYRRVYIRFALIGVLASSIHIYFLLMCAIIVCGYCITDVLKTKKVINSVKLLVGFIFSACATIWVLGGFSSGMEADAVGLGAYSFNLNALWNPQGSDIFHYRSWSSLLPSFPFGISQYEGFAYLGAGGLLLVTIAIIGFLVYGIIYKNHNQLLFSRYSSIGVLFIIIASLIVATSPSVYWGDKLLFKIKLPAIIEKMWAIFRSSGRLIWPVVYILIIVSGAFLIQSSAGMELKILSKNDKNDKKEDAKNSKKPKKTIYSHIYAIVPIFVMACLLIQIVDLKEILEYKGWPFKQINPYSSVMVDSDFWEDLGNDDRIEHIVFMDTNRSISDYYPFGEWALRHHKTLSGFYFARSIETEMQRCLEDEVQMLLTESDKVSNDAFVFFDNDLLSCLQYDLYYYPVDNYIVGLTFPLEGYNSVNREAFEVRRVWSDNYRNNADDIETENGYERVIHEAGFSFGPYWKLPQGKYTVLITGSEELNDCEVKLYSDNGTNIIQCDVIEQNDGYIFLQFIQEHNINGLEVYIGNESTNDVYLYDMILQKRG